MKNIFFSFILPTYKINYLKEAVESILCQSYKNFELIIVNDDSPENVESVIAKYHDERIKYYRNKQNIGGKDLASNWNHCITYAKGEYIVIASDDDIYMPTFLQVMNNLINQYPNVDILRSSLNMINSDGKVIKEEDHSIEFMTQRQYIHFWLHSIHCIGNYVFRLRALLIHNGFVSFPCAWYSDDSTIMMLAKNGIANSSKILFSFRSSDVNISSSNSKNARDKLYAISLFYNWTVKHIIQDEGVYNDIRTQLVMMIGYLVDFMRCKDVFFIYRYLCNNLFLYKEEKKEIFIGYLRLRFKKKYLCSLLQRHLRVDRLTKK